MPNTPTLVEETPSPRCLSTHLPYSALPPQLTFLGCRIIYIARNPKDTFVSHWKFLPPMQNILNFETLSVASKEVFFDSFCNGVSRYGPFVDHVLGFWNASRIQSNILFLTYEGMKADSLLSIKKISDFLGKTSLTEAEIRCIDSHCSFQSLPTLDVNRNGQLNYKNEPLSNQNFFRKGDVGDWKNQFNPEMSNCMDLAMGAKFKEADLFFKYEL